MTTRDRIVSEADRLIYERGYAHTSFTDIADAVGISRGNFYYHFRSKDEILGAILEARMASTQAMLRRWESESADPADRIRSFIRIVAANHARIVRHGCPAGTLCSELAKLGHPLQPHASGILALFRAWLRQQFAPLVGSDGADPLAMHVLAFSQGVAVLSHAFGDQAFARHEVERMDAWLDRIVAGTAPTAAG